jgi:molybdopterin-guanine dinucleotide biosynthesis protein B
MKIIGIVGRSQSGKTSLIRQLIPEIKDRGYSVAVIKHCPHGFTLDLEGKDTWHFTAAGADGVGMASPDEIAIIQGQNREEDFRAISSRYFTGIDIVLVEAGPGIKGLKKIEVLSKESGERVESEIEDLLAVVSEKKTAGSKPHFQPDQVKEIVDFLERDENLEAQPVFLEVDGESLSLNPFVSNLLEHLILGVVRSLKGVKTHPKNMTLSLSRGNREDEES